MAKPPSKVDALYQAWQADPSPDRLNQVVGALQPTIDYSLSSINANGDAYLKSKARVLAARAVTQYSPAHGAGMSTWVTQQLMPLRREKRMASSPVRVPDRVQLDAYSLLKAQREFMDKHDREPDVNELADAAKMSVKRIEKIRRAFRPTPTEGAFEGGTAAHDIDFSGEAVEYVYRDADFLDRKIIEHKTGYGGVPQLEPKDIAVKLKLTPSQLSRRSAKLALQIQQVERDLTSTS